METDREVAISYTISKDAANFGGVIRVNGALPLIIQPNGAMPLHSRPPVTRFRLAIWPG